MFDTLIEDIARLHRDIHSTEAGPTNEPERQALYIFSNTQRILLELIYDNVGLRTLEMGLLYNWLRLATLNRGYDDHHFSTFSTQLDLVAKKLIDEIKALEAELDDAGPTPALAELGEKVQNLRDLFGEVNDTNLPRHEIERQTEKTMSALFTFTADCLQQEMHPGLLESAMLYYWLRSSTINAGVPETFSRN